MMMRGEYCARQARRMRIALSIMASVLASTGPLGAQTTGRVLGRIVDSETDEPLVGVQVHVPSLEMGTLTDANGRFILVAVPAGTWSVRSELIGYQTVTVEGVRVRAGQGTQIEIRLTRGAVAIEGITVQADRVRLIEPEVGLSHEVVTGRELRDLPVDAVAQAIELAPGVSDGHIRGGRVGQAVYVIDGLPFKNAFGTSVRGAGLEISPTALAEVDVVTGGFGARYGSALSGVIRFTTRRGHPERWNARASFLTDHLTPDPLFRGFSGLSISVGGPVPFLGEGATVFADVLAQGKLDADPRARGLTCVGQAEAGGALAAALESRTFQPGRERLLCPYTPSLIPHQRGDKLLAFLRFDKPLTDGLTLTSTVLYNRSQQELYTPAFKYNPVYQLGRSEEGGLLTLTLDWHNQGRGSGQHVSVRGAASVLDRYLGVVDPWTFTGRTRIAGFGWSSFRFLGESFARRPVREQLEAGTALPGYEKPGGSTGSPFGPAAEGIFFTEGTPELASWSRAAWVGGDITAEFFSAEGHLLRVGGSARFYRVESYERVLSYLPGSAPFYARFFPAKAGGFVEIRLDAAHGIIVELGARYDLFRSGLVFRRDEADILSPLVETTWKTSFMPRIGVTGPLPGTEGRMAWRFDYALVSQPPDFRYFLDTTIGDSLRTDIERQGNPRLGFERGSSYEFGLSRILGDDFGLGFTAFYKEYSNLTTAALSFAGRAPNQFTTGDYGSATGLEFSADARLPGLSVRLAYTLQKATGVTSGALDSTVDTTGVQRETFPLAFDRRHAVDLAVFAGRAAGADEQPWSGVMTAQVQSGYPFSRQLAAGDLLGPVTQSPYLPWTAYVDLRVSREMGGLPGCDGCAWRVVLDGRNILGRNNIIALRRTTGSVAPALGRLEAAADLPADYEVIPRESPRYSRLVDFDGDGLITASEYQSARFFAALDRRDPSLFFGAARQLRVGIEVSF